jgi:hypothetical protein
MDAATTSVIVSGIVAVAGIFLPLLFRGRVEAQKWKRERRAADEEAITNSTSRLLAALAEFHAGHVGTRGNHSYQQLRAIALSRFYAWEQVIRPYCNEKQELGLMRGLAENKNQDEFEVALPNLTNKVVNFADSARKKLASLK